MPNGLEQALGALNLGAGSSTANPAAQSTFTPSQIDAIRRIAQTLFEQNESQNDVESDPEIDFSNASQVEKVPDVVKSLRQFSGNPGEFSSWRKSVDRVLEMFQSIQNSVQYYAILHVIRDKIVGSADAALESYRTPLNWKKIKKCLMMHYSDKRDISTLEYQLTTLTQGNNSVTAFYQTVYQHLSLILDKIDCLELSEESLVAMTNSYRDKALDTFVRGLNGDLPRLMSVREPTSLPQALQICMKLENMNYRQCHAQRTQHLNYSKLSHQVAPPRLPPKPIRNNNFFPELAHFPANQQYQNRNNFNQYQPNRQMQPPHNNQFQQRLFNNNNFYQQPRQFNFPNHFQQARPPMPAKPIQRPEPMDVDHSIHSRQINYQNRPGFNPHFQNRKQFFPRNQGSGQIPIKRPRNFHISPIENELVPYEQGTYKEQMVDQDDYDIGADTQFVHSYEDQVESIEAEDKINFLEQSALHAPTSNTQ